MRIPVTQMSNEALLRQLLDAIPSYVFLVDRDVTILDYNAAAGAFLGVGRRSILRHRAGDVFHCLHSRDVTAGCGHGPSCQSCLVRNAVNEAFAGKKCVRRQVRMELSSGRTVEKLNVLLTASPFTYQGHERVVLILEDLGDIAALQRLLPLSLNSTSLKNQPGRPTLRA
jgi:PAS domain-containing protein